MLDTYTYDAIAEMVALLLIDDCENKTLGLGTDNYDYVLRKLREELVLLKANSDANRR